MELKITPSLLSDISRDLSSGRGIWGMLRVNEYLKSDDPLRKALLGRAQTSAKSELTAIENKIYFQGVRLSELNASEQGKIIATNLPEKNRNRHRVIVRSRRGQERKIAINNLRKNWSVLASRKVRESHRMLESAL